MTNDKIKIIIADDHQMFRQGLGRLLIDFNYIEVIAEASNGKKLMDLLNCGVRPDVLLLDLKMPDMNGFEVLEELERKYPETKTIVVSMENQPRHVVKAFEYGAQAYLPKNMDIEMLKAAIDEVSKGNRYTQDSISKILANRQKHKKNQAFIINEKIKISPRELEVLQLLVKGNTTTEIGKELHLSHRTIEGHRHRLMEKTQTRNTAELVTFAFRNALIE